MAEVVGLVVGVVSLGVQLAESVQKVKRFYNAVKDAPERLADIIDEIESLSDILTEMERDRTSSMTDLGPKMQRCVATCRKAVDKFSTYADSLESCMKRYGRRGSVKFATKSENIEGVISRLESSKSNLVLAYMLYREAAAEKRAIQMQQQMGSMAVAQALLPHQLPVVLTTTSVNNDLQPLSSRRRTNVARLSSPKWLSRSIWEMEIERAISGWTLSLRSYRVVPFESPVLQACLIGNVVRLQQLFDRREASPFDRVQDRHIGDYNLLLTAAVFQITDIARLLITATGGTLGIEAFPIKLAWRSWSALGRYRTTDISALRRHFALLLEYRDSDEYSDSHDSSLDQVRTFAFGSAEDANLVLFWNEILYLTQHLSAARRELAWSMLLDAVILDGEIKYLVGPRAIDYLNREGIERRSAAHLLTLACIASAVSSTRHSTSNARILSELVAEAQHHGIGPLERDRNAISPMLRLLHPEPSHSGLTSYKGWKDLRAILKAWLSLLQQLGVDLAAYGEEEWRLFQSTRRRNKCERPWDVWHGTQPHSCYEGSIYCFKGNYDDWLNLDDLDSCPTLFSFSYGAALADWEIWEAHPGDQYAGQFWTMIEQVGFSLEGKDFCGQEMPGGWLED